MVNYCHHALSKSSFSKYEGLLRFENRPWSCFAKNANKFEMLPLVIFCIISKLPLFLFWNPNFTKISIKKKKKKKPSCRRRTVAVFFFYYVILLQFQHKPINPLLLQTSSSTTWFFFCSCGFFFSHFFVCNIFLSSCLLGEEEELYLGEE